MTNEERELAIRAAMRDIAAAFLQRDVTLLQEALADDFTGYDPAGIVVSKSRWLDDLASGELAFTSIESDELEFLHGAESVRVRGRLTFRAHYSRSNYNGSFRYLGVFAPDGERWKLLLSTARRLPAEASAE